MAQFRNHLKDKVSTIPTTRALIASIAAGFEYYRSYDSANRFLQKFESQITKGERFTMGIGHLLYLVYIAKEEELTSKK